ncbi:hypothetical protein BU16DRAFT_603035 [Lophium mytilinum]|uniref:Uncharacterized protein n=1 Tax=Lophium mytilinum TaxID=390894 RepID=A0A6A6R3J6_9PEZI|nr:hypothetical protein BU16DRAFT_603035 [Lophium mytilinum]
MVQLPRYRRRRERPLLSGYRTTSYSTLCMQQSTEGFMQRWGHRTGPTGRLSIRSSQLQRITSARLSSSKASNFLLLLFFLHLINTSFTFHPSQPTTEPSSISSPLQYLHLCLIRRRSKGFITALPGRVSFSLSSRAIHSATFSTSCIKTRYMPISVCPLHCSLGSVKHPQTPPSVQQCLDPIDVTVPVPTIAGRQAAAQATGSGKAATQATGSGEAAAQNLHHFLLNHRRLLKVSTPSSLNQVVLTDGTSTIAPRYPSAMQCLDPSKVTIPVPTTAGRQAAAQNLHPFLAEPCGPQPRAHRP